MGCLALVVSIHALYIIYVLSKVCTGRLRGVVLTLFIDGFIGCVHVYGGQFNPTTMILFMTMYNVQCTLCLECCDEAITTVCYNASVCVRVCM